MHWLKIKSSVRGVTRLSSQTGQQHHSGRLSVAIRILGVPLPTLRLEKHFFFFLVVSAKSSYRLHNSNTSPSVQGPEP